MLKKSIVIVGGNRESEDSPLDSIIDYCKKKKLTFFSLQIKFILKNQPKNLNHLKIF